MLVVISVTMVVIMDFGAQIDSETASIIKPGLDWEAEQRLGRPDGRGRRQDVDWTHWRRAGGLLEVILNPFKIKIDIRNICWFFTDGPMGTIWDNIKIGPLGVQMAMKPKTVLTSIGNTKIDLEAV